MFLQIARRALLRPHALVRSASALSVQPKRSFSQDRDVEKVKTEKEFVALLRRIADAVEADKSFRIQVDKVRLTVPETAEVSVEHEQEGNEHNIELQFKWTAAK